MTCLEVLYRTSIAGAPTLGVATSREVTMVAPNSFRPASTVLVLRFSVGRKTSFLFFSPVPDQLGSDTSLSLLGS